MIFMLKDLCAGEGWTKVLNLIGDIFKLIQIFIPILLIIIGSVDLGKAVISSDEKAIKESQGMLVKRVIAAVLVFFVSAIVSIVMGLIGESAYENCWNKINDTSNTTETE
ncbi:MAG: hypothetical protein PHQ89_02635 [Bacilli bacterium]|nr:hypothetical protein [Bacilli bacterium]